MTTKIKTKTACERDNQIRELTDVELLQVTGGADSSGAGNVAHTEFVIRKFVDKASPVLF
jgi:type VI protein secretion system component Hcp